MNKILEQFGYQHEKLQFNNKRSCGVWLLIIGIVTITAAITGGKLCINIPVFILGYMVGIFLCYGNKKIIFNRLSCGGKSKFQENMSNIAFVVLGVMCTISGMSSYLTHSMRTTWLLLFLATGIHFLVFYFVHGKSMVLICIITCTNAIVGLLFPQIPFVMIGVIDGLIKAGFGMFLLFFSKVTDDFDAFYTLIQK